MSTTKDHDGSSTPGVPLRKNVPQTQAQYPAPLVMEEILPEEREFFRKCIYGTVLKSGVPFAVVLHYLSKYTQNKAVNQIAPKHFLMRTFIFFGNVIFGSLLYSPVCVHKLKVFHEENKKMKNELLSTSFPAVEGVSTSSISEDFSYPSDIISSLNEPESSFSSDFSSSSLLSNEEEKKFLSTTYEDLRTRNRSGTSQSNIKPSSHLNIERQEELDPARIKSSAFNEPPTPPQRITKKNKYGDEME